MKASIIYLFLLISFSSFSQLSVSYFGGISSSSHQDLKDIQFDVSNNIGIQTQVINEFEPTYHWSLRAIYKFTLNEIGIYYLQKSTGGRVGAKDNTGSYRLDQLVDLNSIGIVYKRYLNENFSLGCRFGFTSTSNEIEESLSVFDTSLLSDKFLFEASGFEFNPLVSYRWRPIKPVALIAEVGYSIDSSSKFKLDGQETTISPNWSGYRMELGVQLYLSNLDSSEEKSN